MARRRYTRKVKFGSIAKVLALASALLVIGSGCGGFYAAPSFSPLMFLLPGMVQAKPASPQPPGPGQTETNLTVAQAY
jgi:hypothetical protein